MVHALFSQDGCQREGFWEVVGHVVSLFDLPQTLLVGEGLLVLCSLPGSPVIKQLMQMVTMVPIPPLELGGRNGAPLNVPETLVLPLECRRVCRGTS